MEKNLQNLLHNYCGISMETISYLAEQGFDDLSTIISIDDDVLDMLGLKDGNLDDECISKLLSIQGLS